MSRSAQEEKIRKEKNEIWKELLISFNVLDEEAEALVEGYSVEALRSAIIEVKKALKRKEISQESDQMIQILKKNLNLS